MKELIKIKDPKLQEYEDLVLRKEMILDESNMALTNYISFFGKYQIKVLNLKIDCIKYKKMIEYCQIRSNKNKKILKNELERYIEDELVFYKENLKKYIINYNKAKKAKLFSETELLISKTIYHRIMKLIHPDINKKLFKYKEIEKLYNQVVEAYHNVDIERLEELETIIKNFIQNHNLGDYKIDILDIDRKIMKINKEISILIKNEPYILKEHFKSTKSVEKEKNRFNKEIKKYNSYLKELKKELSKFEIDEELN